MNNKFKRALSSILTFVMVLSAITVMNVSNVFAADVTDYDSSLTAITKTTTIDMSELGITADLTGVTENGLVAGYKAGWKSGSDNAITVGDKTYSGALNVKAIGSRAFSIKVGGACTVTAYGNVNGSRQVAIATAYSSSPSNVGSYENHQSYATTTYNYTGTDEQILYFYSNNGSDIRVNFITVTFTTTKPTVELSAETLAVPLGGSATLTTSTQNLGEAPTITWASDNESVATVSDGVVSGIAKGTAKITATATDGTNTATAACDVTVSESNTVSISKGSSIADVTLTSTEDSTKTYTATGTTIEGVDFGTYNVTFTNYAPLTYLTPNAPETITVGAENISIDLTTSLNASDSFEFGANVYETLYGKTARWSVGNPTSFGYLNAIEQSQYVKIAASTGSSGGDSQNIYAYVKDGKINTVGRSSNFQFNADTKFIVPVAAGSVITIVNYKYDTTDTNNEVYTIIENATVTGDGVISEDVGTYDFSDSNNKTMNAVYEKTYTYSGNTEGYITILGESGGYLTSVTVTTPEKAATTVIREKTVATVGDTTYAIFAVSESEANSYASFNIVDGDGNELLDEGDDDTVYSGISFDGDDTAEYTAADEYYIVAYIISKADNSNSTLTAEEYANTLSLKLKNALSADTE